MATRRFNPTTLLPAQIGMDIRFWLRRGKRPGLPGMVYCTLTTDRVACTPFSTGIPGWPAVPGQRPNPRTWQPGKIQRLFGEAADIQADNGVLTALYATLRSLRTKLQDEGRPADAVAVAEAYRGFGVAAPTLAEAVALFLADREGKQRSADAPAWDKTGYAATTLKKYRCRLGLLTEYLKKQQATKLPLAKFTAKHADGLAALVMSRPDARPGKHAGRRRGRGGAHYAGKVVGLVSQVLDFAINQEWLAVNPLAAWAAPAGFEKELVYLWPEQVRRLEQHAFASEYLQRVADSFLFSCWTGLAWADLDALNEAAHIDAAGWLSMLRHKTGVAFNLPVLPGAARLLAKYAGQPGGLPRYENSPLNRALKEVAAILDLPADLTHHAGRRTFGMYLLNEDVPLATVAAVLGHKNQRTTEKYYAKFIERRKIERDLAALQARLRGNTP